MNLNEYQKQLADMKERHKKELGALHTEYAKGQRIFEINDIIREHDRIMRVDKFTTHLSFNTPPIPVYIGIEMTKALQPKKYAKEIHIFGNKDVVLVKKAEKNLEIRK